MTAPDDTQSSAPVLTFHLVSGTASVSSQDARTYSGAYSEGSGGEGVWSGRVGGCRSWRGAGGGRGASTQAADRNSRKEVFERRSSMDIRHPQWSMAGSQT